MTGEPVADRAELALVAIAAALDRLVLAVEIVAAAISQRGPEPVVDAVDRLTAALDAAARGEAS